MDSGDSCTRMQMYLMPLHYTLKMVSFALCIFYQHKNNARECQYVLKVKIKMKSVFTLKISDNNSMWGNGLW